MKNYRVMNRGNEQFEVEELSSNGWNSVCFCKSIEESKEVLKNLRMLEEEKDDETV